MESCVVCLKSNADIFSRIGIDTTEWKELNIQRIIEKHLWWWYLKKPTNYSVQWICRQCWQEVSSFHNFYIKVENEHNQFKMKMLPALNNDTDNELLIVKRECPVFDSEYTLRKDMMPLEKRKRGRKKKAAKNIEEINIEEHPVAEVVKNENELFVAQNVDKTNIEYEINDVVKTSESLDDIWEPDIHSKNNTDSEESLDDIWEPDIHSTNNTDSEDEAPRQRKPRTKKDVTKKKNKAAKKQKPNTKNEIYKKTEVSKKNDEFLAENQFELTCSLCKVPLTNFSELKSHYRDEHDILGHVMCCDRKFFKRDLLVDHLRVHKDPNYFKCPQCDRTLANRENYENHLEYHKESKEPRELTFNCDKCEKSFFNKASLESHQLLHMEEHAGATPCETCNLCGEKLTNKYALTEHIKMEHKEEILLEQKCPYCSRISASIRALRQHIKYAHTMERKYSCHMCDKSFKRPVELREHLSTHTGEPLYTCPYCPRTFFSNSNKHTHRKLAHRKEWEEDRLKKIKKTQ